MVAKDIFPFATVTDGCEEANFMGFFHKYELLDSTSWKFSQKNVNLIEKFYESNLFATISNGWTGENILCNNDSWLQSRNN